MDGGRVRDNWEGREEGRYYRRDNWEERMDEGWECGRNWERSFDRKGAGV